MNKRQAKILMHLVYGKRYAAADIQALFATDNISPATLRRDITSLENFGYIVQDGEKRWARYTKTVSGAFEAPYGAHVYFTQEELVRNGLSAYQFGVLEYMSATLFSDEDRAALDAATKKFREKSAAAASVREKELERFVIELSWKSSQIEGNTYTLLDTERLLRDGVAAPGHTKDEAHMIINHKNAFRYTQEHRATKLTREYIERVHQLLVADLAIPQGIRSGAVGITGTSYRPLELQTQLLEQLDVLCHSINRMTDAYSRALAAVVGLSYIQAFADGNKRTARLVANALLIAAECAPLSYRTVDQVEYKECMLAFYEQLTLVPMRTIVREQYLFSCEQYVQV